MIIEPIKSLSVDVVPQAVIGWPIKKLVGQVWPIFQDADDLDSFEGASFKLNNKIEIAVRHYRGHPKDTTTIYIDRSQSNIDQITQIIRQVLAEFKVPFDAIQWERRDDPEL